MSDCSTQAVEPKEPQTLSNCCPYCGNPTPHANAIRNRQHSVDEVINDAWKEKQSLEQRCQQLRQVTKEMLDAIRISSSYHMAVKDCYYKAFVLQLEELGVSLDG